MKELRNFSDYHKLLNREFYDYYKENRTHQALAIDQYKYFVKAIGGLIITIKKLIQEKEGGVYIEGFGYFCIVKAKKRRINPSEKSPLKKKAKKDSFKIWFIPEEDYSKWYLMNFDVVKSNKHRVELEAIKLHLELTEYNRKLKRENNDIKYMN